MDRAQQAANDFGMSRRLLYFVVIVAVLALLLSAASVVLWIAHSPRTNLHRAAFEGDILRIEAAARRQPGSLNSCRSFRVDKRRSRIAPIMWAVRGEQISAARRLLTLGADVDTHDDFGRTALWLACEQDDVAMARVLLSAGADPNVVTNFGSSPLVCAIRNRNLRMLRLLLENGANADGAGRTLPLYESVATGQLEATKMLLEHGAAIRSPAERAQLVEAAKRSDSSDATGLETLLQEAGEE